MTFCLRVFSRHGHRIAFQQQGRPLTPASGGRNLSERASPPTSLVTGLRIGLDDKPRHNHPPSTSPLRKEALAKDAVLTPRRQRMLARHEAAKIEARRRGRDAPEVDSPMSEWRQVYVKLLEALPTDATEHLERTDFVQYPMSVFGTVTNRNVLARVIDLTCDCHVQFITPPTDSNTADIDHGSVALHGMPAAIEDAKSLLRAVYGMETEVPPSDIEPLQKQLDDSKLKVILTLQPHVWAHRAGRNVENLRKPHTMTVITFAAYVEDLVGIQLKGPRHAEHFTKVADTLVFLFTDEVFHPAWSSRAAVMAVQFLCKHRRIRAALTVVANDSRSEMMGTSMVQEALLESAAKAQDLRAFQSGVQNIFRDGHVPSWRIWLLFIRLMKHFDPKVANNLVVIMRRHSLVKSTASRIAVANELLSIHYKAWLDAGKSVESFIMEQDREWETKEWLTSDALLTILTPLANRAQFDQARAVMAQRQDRYTPLSIPILEMLVKNARRHGDVAAAVEACSAVCSARSSLAPNEYVYGTLFKLAWSRRYLNVLCTVWVYSLLDGHNTPDMKAAMLKSIAACEGMMQQATAALPLTASIDSDAQRSDMTAAALTVESPTSITPTESPSQTLVNLGTASQRSSDPPNTHTFQSFVGVCAILGAQVPPPINSVRGQKTDDTSSDLKAALETQIRDVRRCATTRAFSEALREAYHRDVELKRRGGAQSCALVFRDLIKVPVAFKRSADTTPSVTESKSKPRSRSSPRAVGRGPS